VNSGYINRFTLRLTSSSLARNPTAASPSVMSNPFKGSIGTSRYGPLNGFFLVSIPNLIKYDMKRNETGTSNQENVNLKVNV